MFTWLHCISSLEKNSSSRVTAGKTFIWFSNTRFFRVFGIAKKKIVSRSHCSSRKRLFGGLCTIVGDARELTRTRLELRVRLIVDALYRPTGESSSSYLSYLYLTVSGKLLPSVLLFSVIFCVFDEWLFPGMFCFANIVPILCQCEFCLLVVFSCDIQ